MSARPGRPWWLSGAVLLAALLVACARPDVPPRDVRLVTIVAVSDWHGQLEPVEVQVGARARQVGGAAVLKGYFGRERRRNPSGVLVVTAGDAFGATPPLSSFFEDVPAIEAQNALAFDVDTLGNHNFDHGLERLRRLMSLARFPYVAANIVDAEGQGLAPPTHVFTRNGVRIGVIGIGNPETPALVAPGRTGPYRFLDPVPVVNAHARALRAAGVDIVVVLAHVGADSVDRDGTPRGPLADLARGIAGVDVLMGDHSDVSVNASVNGITVVENRSRGVEYSVIDLEYDAARKAIVRRVVRQQAAFVDGASPDAAVQSLVERYRERLRPLFDRRLGQAALALTRARDAESLLGNFETDTLRAAYGTQLAFDVSGAFRDDLPSSYQPKGRGLRRPAPGYAPGPPWDLVQGDLLAVLPFNNVAVTFRLTGRVLWRVLENSVSRGAVRDGRFTNAAGRFLQVSGFTYRFDARRPAGRRVVGVAQADGTPIPADERLYTAVTSEFVFRGGDGYTMLVGGGGVTRELIADTVAAAIERLGTVAPRIEGRIVDVSATAGR